MKRLILFVAIASAFATAPATADLFFDDFQGDLSAWVGKLGGAHHGVIVVDPLDPTNNVLTFTQTNWGGDVFATQTGFDLTSGQQYTVSLRYLGDPTQGGTPGDLGGYAGFASDLSPTSGADSMWYAGTGTAGGAPNNLIDDGAWHSYSYTFTAPSIIGNHVYLILQDFWATGYPLNNIAGDAYFDDVRLVPVPGAVLLGLLGLGAAGARLRRFA